MLRADHHASRVLALTLLVSVLSCVACSIAPTAHTHPQPLEPKNRPDVDWSPLDPDPIQPTAVDSLRPRFRWRAFDLAAARAADPWYGEVDDLVRYDLRVWKLGPRAILVYERRGLARCEHWLESDLEPHRRYRWSVRARFMRQGETRLSDWSTVFRNWRCNPFHGGEGYLFRTPER